MQSVANFFVDLFHTFYSNGQINWGMVVVVVVLVLLFRGGWTMLSGFLPLMFRAIRTPAQYRTEDNVDWLCGMPVWEYNFSRFAFVAFPVIIAIGLILWSLGG